MFTPFVARFSPIVRQGQSAPDLLPMSAWIDNLVLQPGVSQQYVLPKGPNPAFGTGAGQNTSVPALIQASILRVVVATGIVWVNANSSVTIPVVNITNGMGSVPIAPGHGYYIFQVPISTVGSVGFLSPNGATISIEAWF